MPMEDNEPRSPLGPRHVAHLLSIVRWLLDDNNRTLPRPEDEAGIVELAEAIGQSPEYTRALMAGFYGRSSAGDTIRLLT